MSRITKVRAVAAILAAAALVFIIASLGKWLPAPFAGSIELDGPAAADSSGEVTAIVDSQSRRLLILDSSGAVTASVNVDSADSSVELINDVCVSGGYVYVVGVVYEDAGDAIKKESILKYDVNGNLVETVSTLVPQDDVSNTFRSVSSAPDGVGVVVEHKAAADNDEYTGPTIEFVNISSQGSDVVGIMYDDIYGIHQFAYNAATGRHAAITFLGALTESGDLFAPSEFPEYVMTSLALGDGGEAYVYDDAGRSVVKIADGKATELLGQINVERLHANGDFVTACDMDNSRIVVCANDGSDNLMIGTDVGISTGLRAYALLFWLLVIYLAAFIVVELIAQARRIAKSGKPNRIGSMLGSVVVVVIIATAVGYFTNASYEESVDTRSQEVNAFADYLSRTSDRLSDDMERAGDRELFRATSDDVEEGLYALAGIDKELSAIANSANENDIDLYFTVYAKDERGVFHVYDSSMAYVIGTNLASEQNAQAVEEAFDSTDVPDTLYTGHLLRDTTVYRLVGIPSNDGEGFSGVVELGSRMKSLESSLVGNQFTRVVALFVIMLVIYLAYSELRAAAECFFDRRRLLAMRPGDAIASLARPLSLAATLLQSVDGVMTVLIARSMVASMGSAHSSMLIALPAVFLGIGMVIGSALYAALVSRVGLRKLMVCSMVAILVLSLATILVVMWGNLWAYCAAKMLLSAPFAMFYAVCSSLPRLASDPDVASRAGNGITLTDTSAAALGTVLGGYVAQVLGNEWVYAIVAIVSILVIVAAVKLIPRGFGPIEEGAEDSSTSRHLVKSMFNPKALPLALLVTLPALLANGYNTFLFPLYSADAGLSTSAINNMFVLGQLVVYVLIATLIKMRTKHGSYKTTVIALVLLGVVLLLLSFNQTIVWAVVAIVLVGVLFKASDGWKGMWINVNEDNGYPYGVALATLLSVRSIMLVVQPLILGLVLSAGSSFAVIIVGIICVVCALVFACVTRKSALVRY